MAYFILFYNYIKIKIKKKYYKNKNKNNIYPLYILFYKG